MKNLEKVEKQLAVLLKFAQQGRDSEITRKLSRNLYELKNLVSSKQVPDSFLSPVTVKQSIASAVMTSSNLLAQYETMQLNDNLKQPLPDSEIILGKTEGES